ncbi:MAG: LON peptidase substrate-binding domain-containing protein, partial [Hyphomicrobiales bacterium]
MSVQIGNKAFNSREDFPSSVPIFPLSGALLLPKGQMPLNIFEPRYLAMVDAALAG